MKKQLILTLALALSGIALHAQAEKKPVKVRIKKVENINGVEKVTDTTYFTTEPIEGAETRVHMIETNGKEGKRVIVKTRNGDETINEVRNTKRGKELDAEIEKALMEAGVDPNEKGTSRLIVINNDKVEDGKKGEKKITKIVIVKTGINDATATDLKKAGIAEPKERLVLESMNCTPNPSNGKFSLKFSSQDKTSADITVKDINGKIVYTETLKPVDGIYEKEITLGDDAEGIYFVTVMQGQKAITKKLVVE